MAFTKVVGPGIHTLAQLRTHNIHSAGIITATRFVGEIGAGTGNTSTFTNVNVTGNLTVQGDTTTLNTTLRNVELLRVASNSTTTAGIITQTGAGDILNLFDGSTEVLTVTDGGKVGIGITNPGRPLTIRNAEPRIRLIDSDTGSFSEIYTDNSGHLYLNADQGQSNGGSRIVFNVDNDEKFRITSDGKVGIKTAIPGATLDVRGSATIRTGIGNTLLTLTNTSIDIRQSEPSWSNVPYDTNPLIKWGWLNDVGDHLYFASGGNTGVTDTLAMLISDGHGFKIGRSGWDGVNNTNLSTEYFRVDTDGKVGINTTTASSTLQIYAANDGEGTATGQITLKDTANYNQTPTGGVVFQGHHTAQKNSQAIFSGIRGFKANTTDGNYSGSLAFDVRKHGAVAYEAMRIDEDGLVGIGTDNPDNLLHLAGTNTTVWPFTADVSSTYAYTPYPHELQIQNHARDVTGSFAGIYFHSGAAAAGDKMAAARIAAVDSGDYNSDLVFGTRNTNFRERLRIKSDGKVGIGITNPVRHFHVVAASVPVARFERDTDDGNIIDIRDFNNNTIGAIGSNGGNVKFSAENSNKINLQIGASVKFQIEDSYTRILNQNFVVGSTAPTSGDMGGLLPKFTVVGFSTDGKFNTTAMFRCGNDADYSGAKVVLNMSNDRGMALIGGRGSNNRSYGGILSLDNIGRESNVMTYHGGNGAGIGSITFYSGETATTTRATTIHSDGNIQIGGYSQAGGSNPLAYSRVRISPVDRATTFDPAQGSTWHDVVLKQTASSGTHAVGIAFELSTSEYHHNAGTGIAAVKNGSHLDYGSHLAFITRPQSAVAAERMRILDSGNVGIAVTAPGSKFEVDGRIRILDNNDSTPSSGKGLELSYFNTADHADILAYDRGASAYKTLSLRGHTVELRRDNGVLCTVGTGGNRGTVGFLTTTNLVTNAEIISVRGYSSFKSTTQNYAAIYVSNEGSVTDTANALILFNSGGANRGGIGYVPNTGELRFNNQYFTTFTTGATQLGGTERIRIKANGEVRTSNVAGTNRTYSVIGGPEIGSSDAEVGQVNLHDINSPLGDIGGWVYLGADYHGAHPWPVKAYKIAKHEPGNNGTRVYQVWHDGDANHHYGSLHEIRLNSWGGADSNNYFSSASISCTHGMADDIFLLCYKSTDGIWVRPSTIWGGLYIRRVGWDGSGRDRGSDYCAVKNGAALAYGDANGMGGTIPGSIDKSLYPYLHGSSPSHYGGYDIEDNGNFYGG